MKFDLNKYILEDIENKDQPSEFVETKDYSVLVLRLPYIKDEIVDVVSDAFLIKEEKIYKYDRKKREFEEFSFDKLHQFLDLRVDKILAKLSKLHTEVAKIEDSLYDGNYSKIDNYIVLKKDLGIIERIMSHTELAFERFVRRFKDNLDEFAFNDLKEHISRVIRFSKSADEKLDYLHSFYRGEVDRRMNKVMFVLTILSAIFMPLTLVTGFFGMNTGGLPFVGDAFGTWKVVGLSIIFEIPFVIYIYKIASYKFFTKN